MCLNIFVLGPRRRNQEEQGDAGKTKIGREECAEWEIANCCESTWGKYQKDSGALKRTRKLYWSHNN